MIDSLPSTGLPYVYLGQEEDGERHLWSVLTDSLLVIVIQTSNPHTLSVFADGPAFKILSQQVLGHTTHIYALDKTRGKPAFV